MKFYNTNTSGLEIGSYYWFDLPNGWAVGKIVKSCLYDKGVAVYFCGSDEPERIPFCYVELIKQPED